MSEQNSFAPEAEYQQLEHDGVDSNFTVRVQEVGLDTLHYIASNLKYSRVLGCLLLTSGAGHIAQGHKIRGTLQTGLAVAMFNQ